MQKNKNKHSELLSYLIVGILTTIVSYGVYCLLTLFFLDPYNKFELQIANVVSWICAVTFAYFTNRKYVFKSEEKNMFKEGSKFYLSRILTLLLDMATMFIMVSLLHVNDKLSKLVSQVLVTIGNYIISKFWVFTKKEKHRIKILPIICKTGLILLCSTIIGTFLLIVSYLLPTNRMLMNAKSAATTFENEGMYRSLIPEYNNTQLDNYTDALIINEAIFESNDNVINKSMYVYRNVKTDPVYDVIHTIKNDNSEFAKGEYSRYWHGNLVFIKPLLLLFNYSQIRVLNIFIQTAMLAVIIYLMIKNNLLYNILDLVVSLFLIFPFVIGMSLQFSSVYYILLISTIIMMKYNEKLKNKYVYLFLIIGILTSYFDLLTFPILGLGMALLFNFLLNRKETLKENVIDIIKYSLFWGIGYFGMWCAKLVVGSILCQDNFFDLAIKAAKYRSSSATLGRASAIIKNIKVYLNKSYFVIMLPVVCYHIIHIIKNRRKITKSMLINCIPYVIICMIPLAWYFVMAEHSEMHFWFTNKSLVVSIFGFLLLLNSLHDFKSNKH